MSCLKYGFPIAQYPIFTSVASTHAMKLHLKLDINRAKTGNYNSIETIPQKVQMYGQASEPTTCRGCCLQTRLIKNAGVTLIKGMQPVRVPYSKA